MKLRRVLHAGCIIVVFIVSTGFFGGKALVKHQANSFAKEAVSVFHKDETKSLLLLIDSEHHPLKDRNRAVWALGILKDVQVLPKLEMLYTGEDCNHKKALCQYELKKAIMKIKGDFKGSW